MLVLPKILFEEPANMFPMSGRNRSLLAMGPVPRKVCLRGRNIGNMCKKVQTVNGVSPALKHVLVVRA